MESDGVKLKNYLYFFIGLLFFGCFYPSIWSMLIFKDSSVLFSFLFIAIWSTIFIIYNPALIINKPNPTFLFFVLALIIYFIVRSIFYNEEVIYTIVVLSLSCLTIVLSNSSSDSKIFMSLFIKFQTAMIFLSIFGVILLYVNLLPPPQQIILSGFQEKIFLNYRFFIVKINILDELSNLYIRSSGYYDEPGSFAFVTLLLLLYNKLHLKSRKYELILLIGGLVTLSAAHIITIFLYFLFFYLNRNNWWILGVFLLLCWGIYHLPIEKEWFTFFKSRTYDRILNIYEGTDKSRDYGTSFEAFKYYFLIGGNIQEILNKFPYANADTIWLTLARHGIIGSFFYYAPFFYLFAKSLSRGIFSDHTKTLILLFVNFLQRPEYITPLYLFIIYFIWFDNKKYKNRPHILIQKAS